MPSDLSTVGGARVPEVAHRGQDMQNVRGSGPGVHACTVIACNYLPYARVLADSFFDHHPHGSFDVLLIDDERRCWQPGDHPSDRRVTWWRLSDLGLDEAEVGRLAGIYEVAELATAVKPLFLRCVLRAGATEVVYLDPDVRIFDSLEDVARLAREHGIVLTPPATHPFPPDDCLVDMYFILAAGAYNLGFVAVGAQAQPFLDWWWNATRRHALHDVTGMVFTDQRWIDLVPGFFTHHILKDDGCNVAYWNLHSREIACDHHRYLVNGCPLRFFHFSGFDPRKPYLLSRHQGDRPRILLSERPALQRLCREYVSSLEQAGYNGQQAGSYGWATLSCGISIDMRMRRLYRQALLTSESRTAADPPVSPFDGDGRLFVEWLNAPEPGGPRRISRYLRSLYGDRVDLQTAFPDIAGADARSFNVWARTGGQQEGIHRELLPPLWECDDLHEDRAELSPGVQIAGYLDAELGVGEAARLLIRAVEFGGIPFSTFCCDDTASRREHPFTSRRTKAFDVNIICVNADGISRFVRHAGPAFSEGRYSVGFWHWELERFPESLHAGFDAVDEVWAATDFVARAIRAANRKPVFTVPPPLLAPVYPREITREQLGLPARFTFLVLFDFFSILERKNPLGAIHAFVEAFAPGEGPVLVLKSINGQRRLNDLERLRAAAAGRDDILIIDDYYSVDEKNALLGACDCYVSLHRSEGLGLTMAEAMALGKPVIATGYSGNLHFMTPENSYLVDYALTPVPAGCDPYPPGAVWASPDVAQAAAFMREIYERPLEARRKAQIGRSEILDRHNLERSARAIATRMDAIRHIRPTAATAAILVDIQRPEPADIQKPPEPADIQKLEPADPEAPPAPPVRTVVSHPDQFSTPRPDAGGRRFGRIRLLAQRALFRVLRPYWFQQQQWQSHLVGALDQAIDAVRVEAEARAQALSREVGLCQEEIRRLQEPKNDVSSTATPAENLSSGNGPGWRVAVTAGRAPDRSS